MTFSGVARCERVVLVAGSVIGASRRPGLLKGLRALSARGLDVLHDGGFIGGGKGTIASDICATFDKQLSDVWSAVIVLQRLHENGDATVARKVHVSSVLDAQFCDVIEVGLYRAPEGRGLVGSLVVGHTRMPEKEHCLYHFNQIFLVVVHCKPLCNQGRSSLSISSIEPSQATETLTPDRRSIPSYSLNRCANLSDSHFSRQVNRENKTGSNPLFAIPS
ncbi:hypothetical protein EGW08_020229 [Elysia chlorotica]|uniref:Uncharacterized protein n=1 Tax=Elysia chlorotica TaxID=188477 RepID=A0A3S1BPY2_ELYCH|nr:hypothetical protein EGW08_020229 [Elysia chlorotica]